MPTSTKRSNLLLSSFVQSEVDTESVGHVLCKKADELDAVAICMATHNKVMIINLNLPLCAFGALVISERIRKFFDLVGRMSSTNA